MTVYASITDGTIDLIDLTATVSAGNVNLTATANSSVASTASVNLVATYVQA